MRSHIGGLLEKASIHDGDVQDHASPVLHATSLLFNQYMKDVDEEPDPKFVHNLIACNMKFSSGLFLSC